MAFKKPEELIEPYMHPAAGWGALKQVAINLVKEKVAGGNFKTLFKQNQPDGFDCPGCAWPDREHSSTFEFCENGVKAVAAEATSKRVTPAFFEEHTVESLMSQSDYELEQHGRLTDPLVYDAKRDRYVPIEWDDAFELIASHLKKLDDPDRAAFYTSGRASNEAAFLYQLFVRMYGTNNFPDCSNMCHEATSRGLPHTVGIGKGMVTLDDFEHADTLLLFGQNPAMDHPRMLGELRDCAKRGATIVSINPLKERGLERFASPQHTLDLLSPKGVKISSVFICPKVGGDLALIKGVAKRVIELDDATLANGNERVLDVEFIAQHTVNFDVFADDLRAESWDAIVAESGVEMDDVLKLADIYVKGRAVISTWGMGLTQHKNSVPTIQLLSNLMMMRGNIGRRGAGLCPVRGPFERAGRSHGGYRRKADQSVSRCTRHRVRFRTAARARLRRRRKHSRDARRQGEGVYWTGRQFFDRHARYPAHLARRVRRRFDEHGAHLVRHEQTGIAEPAVRNGDRRAYGARDAGFIEGGLARARGGLRADGIEKVIPGFANYNERLKKPGGFHLGVASRDRIWKTPHGRAQFIVHNISFDTPIHRARALHGERLMTLMTTHSHDQYNTTIYGLDDRYRGVYGQRHVLFTNRDDIDMLGFEPGERVDITSVWDDGVERNVEGFKLVEYDIPLGCLGAYYPETNPLVPLSSIADGAGTPTSKSIPVLLTRSRAAIAT